MSLSVADDGRRARRSLRVGRKGWSRRDDRSGNNAKRYVRLFDPQFIGLTGSLKSLEPVYVAYYMARQAVPINHGPDDYSIVHGTSLYYIGRDGIMKGFGSWEDDTPELIQDLKRFQ